MTSDMILKIGRDIEDVFFLIGGALLAIELLKLLFFREKKARPVLDIVASASTQLPFLLVETFLLGFVYLGFVYASDAWVSWTLPINVWTILLAVLAADITYYWEHRMAHRIRILWTQHAVHHSSRHFNIVTSIRFGPFEGMISALAHFPLILMGFPAELVFFSIIVVLAYQTWIHTELIGKLGPLEWVLNTPSHHRVHHGCDGKYIDKNYGGILIIWDRLFGTFQREDETPVYGLKRDYDSINPVSVWFSEWPQLFRDLGNSLSFGETWMRLFGTPEWSPKPRPPRNSKPARSKAPAHHP